MLKILNDFLPREPLSVVCPYIHANKTILKNMNFGR
nr:MAG TPA: hypothetical protein [Caudoviricetes sp.]